MDPLSGSRPQKTPPPPLGYRLELAISLEVDQLTVTVAMSLQLDTYRRVEHTVDETTHEMLIDDEPQSTQSMVAVKNPKKSSRRCVGKHKRNRRKYTNKTTINQLVDSVVLPGNVLMDVTPVYVFPPPLMRTQRQFELSGSISGNNGSWTNTDDHRLSVSEQCQNSYSIDILWYVAFYLICARCYKLYNLKLLFWAEYLFMFYNWVYQMCKTIACVYTILTYFSFFEYPERADINVRNYFYYMWKLIRFTMRAAFYGLLLFAIFAFYVGFNHHSYAINGCYFIATELHSVFRFFVCTLLEIGYNFLRKMQFGPGYSSDNAGDGPGGAPDIRDAHKRYKKNFAKSGGASKLNRGPVPPDGGNAGKVDPNSTEDHRVNEDEERDTIDDAVIYARGDEAFTRLPEYAAVGIAVSMITFFFRFSFRVLDFISFGCFGTQLEDIATPLLYDHLRDRYDLYMSRDLSITNHIKLMYPVKMSMFEWHVMLPTCLAFAAPDKYIMNHKNNMMFYANVKVSQQMLKILNKEHKGCKSDFTMFKTCEYTLSKFNSDLVYSTIFYFLNQREFTQDEAVFVLGRKERVPLT